ncbi:MAG TPA: acyl-CoA dehydrogenase family protein [Ramlibacter sp.]|nr:acyl-CoA dehydrogenase family protein [Ramlibacter sp.]
MTQADSAAADAESALVARARALADERIRPHAADVDMRERYPEEGLAALAAAGLCGLSVPKAYGGLDADARTACHVIEEISRGCASTGALMLTYAGSTLALVHYASADMRDRYLPGVATGQLSLGFALTERHCGSDAAAIRASAVREGDGWVLNGDKAWIGNAARADLIVVAVKTDPAAGGKGMSSFLVPRGTPGVEIGEIYSKMGARGTVHSDLHLRNVRLGPAHLLGRENQGFAQMMHSLDYVRLVTAAHATGIARAAYDEAVRYVRERETFGQPLSRHQALAFMVADMATELHAARLVMLDAARCLDAGQKVGAQAAMAKLVATETATRIAHRAVQIHGAWGVKVGSVVERAYRDARVTEIWDGTSEIQRLIIARSILGR